MLGIYPMTRFPQILQDMHMWLFTVGLLIIIKQTNNLPNNNKKAKQSLLRWVVQWSVTSIPLLTHSSQMLGWECAATHQVRWSGGQRQKSGIQVARSSHISGERRYRVGYQGPYHHAEEWAVGGKVREAVVARSRWVFWTMVRTLFFYLSEAGAWEGSEQRKDVVWLKIYRILLAALLRTDCGGQGRKQRSSEEEATAIVQAPNPPSITHQWWLPGSPRTVWPLLNQSSMLQPI